MNRLVRNRLADLLLGAFRRETARDAIFWLALCCDLDAEEARAGVGVGALHARWSERYSGPAPGVRRMVEAAEELAGLLQVERTGGAPGAVVAPARVMDDATWLVHPHADLLPHLSDVRACVQAYAEAAQEMTDRRDALCRMSPLRRAVAEGVICFNAGLFFEAHEHLEHCWSTLPAGPDKRFVQGLIQISVGFHHAVRGSYEGAVNQLEKGLAKLAEPPSEEVGIDRVRFGREVAAFRRRLVVRGRERMQPSRPADVPRVRSGD